MLFFVFNLSQLGILWHYMILHLYNLFLSTITITTNTPTHLWISHAGASARDCMTSLNTSKSRLSVCESWKKSSQKFESRHRDSDCGPHVPRRSAPDRTATTAPYYGIVSSLLVPRIKKLIYNDGKSILFQLKQLELTHLYYPVQYEATLFIST